MDLTVTITVKVPFDRASALSDRLSRLLKLQIEDEKKLNLKIKSGRATPNEHRMLVERRRRLNTNNLAREAIFQGLAVLEKTTDGDLLTRLGEEGVARGRPRAA